MNTPETLPDFPWARERHWMRWEKKLRPVFERIYDNEEEAVDAAVRLARRSFDLTWFEVKNPPPPPADGETLRSWLARVADAVRRELRPQFRAMQWRACTLEFKIWRMQETLRAHGIPYEDDVEIGEMPESGD